MSTDARTRDWRDPFTHQTWRAVPARLADRLDTLAAAAAAHKPWSVESSHAREQLRTQLQHLLMAFSHRAAYRRTIDEIHAGDDGLLPISTDHRSELDNRARTFAGLRDLEITFAVEDGASLEDAALAAGITLEDARAVLDSEHPPAGELT